MTKESFLIAVGFILLLVVFIKKMGPGMINDLSYCKWFRRLSGGRWSFYKLGRDTPNIRMFSVWTHEDDDDLCDESIFLLEKEKYPERRWTKFISRFSL